MALVSDYELTVRDANALCELYEPHPAWGERNLEEVASIIEGSDEVVGLREQQTGDLVASARILTDYHIHAMVYDVIVAKSRRGEGLGRQIMKVVANHPALQDVTLTLHCREDLVGFYEQCDYVLFDRDAIELEDGKKITYRTMKLIRE